MDGQFSTLESAKHAVVHEYPGGAVRLAARCGMNAGTLSNKVNPHVDTHHLSVDEAVVLQNVAGDHRILAAEAAAQGYSVVATHDFGSVSNGALIDAQLSYAAEVGKTAECLRQALADGVVTRRELADFEAEALADVAALMELLARVRALTVAPDDLAAARLRAGARS